jgi:predicted TIM-barrel fold metal-dependent hydrolase
LFDAHLHVIDPRFPLLPGYVPPAFTVADYRERTAALGITGGAVVSGSFQGFDQRYLLDALERLGPGFVGVTQLPGTATDAEILALDGAGVRGVRLNLRRGGAADLRLAERAHALAGWHTEIYATGAEIAALEPRLRDLPKLSIDHLGLDADSLDAVARLAAGGAAVKATGFGRVELDVRAALRAIAAANPRSLMFGTDLPGTRARRPFEPADAELVRELAGDDALGANARAFYRVAG